MELTHAVLKRPTCPIHYWTGGSAERPLIVLTHGATMDHRMFEAQIAALIPEYRVLTWDVRGHGQSQPLTGKFTLDDCVADLIALLDTLGAADAVLVGQSMGGYIHQFAYLHHPERVRAMVIIGSVSVASPYSRVEMMTLKASLPMLKWWPYENFKQTVAKTIGLRPAVRAYALDAISQLTRADFLNIWEAVTLAVSERGLPDHKIRIPFLLTHGDHDTTGTIRRDAPKWAASEPDVEYVVIPDASHNANQDNAGYFNQVLLNFLRKRVG